MSINQSFAKEVAMGDLERELAVTRKVLDRVPDEHFEWKPHEKSMSLAKLASHVADLPRWARDALARDVLDFAETPPPPEIKNRRELLAYFDKNVVELREAVAHFDVEKLQGTWTMRNGTQVITTQPRSKVYRVWCVNHLVHHRGQLCLYLRLLNVPVPAVYFNSSDEPEWIFE